MQKATQAFGGAASAIQATVDHRLPLLALRIHGRARVSHEFQSMLHRLRRRPHASSGGSGATFFALGALIAASGSASRFAGFSFNSFPPSSFTSHRSPGCRHSQKERPGRQARWGEQGALTCSPPVCTAAHVPLGFTSRGALRLGAKHTFLPDHHAAQVVVLRRLDQPVQLHARPALQVQCRHPGDGLVEWYLRLGSLVTSLRQSHTSPTPAAFWRERRKNLRCKAAVVTEAVFRFRFKMVLNEIKSTPTNNSSKVVGTEALHAQKGPSKFERQALRFPAGILRMAGRMVALGTAAAAARASAGRVAASSPRSEAASLLHARSAPVAASLRPWHAAPLVGARCFCAKRSWELQPGRPAGKRSLSAGAAGKDDESSQEAKEEGGQEVGDVKKEILERALEHVHTWGWTTQVRKHPQVRALPRPGALHRCPGEIRGL